MYMTAAYLVCILQPITGCVNAALLLSSRYPFLLHVHVLSTSHTSAGISGITDLLVGIHLSGPRRVAPQHQLYELTSFARFS